MADKQETTVIPKWLWGGIIFVIVMCVGALGSVSTWMIYQSIDARVAIATHDVLIQEHGEKIKELERSIDDIKSMQLQNSNMLLINSEKLDRILVERPRP